MKKIKDKIEYIPVEAQGSYACEHDCVEYKNKKAVGIQPPKVVDGAAITAPSPCSCTSKKDKTPSGWSGW